MTDDPCTHPFHELDAVEDGGVECVDCGAALTLRELYESAGLEVERLHEALARAHG